jgi:CheY-like chemotaxis protein
MTAHAMVEERAKCLALGMDGIITKPIDPAELAATLAGRIKPAGQGSPASAPREGSASPVVESILPAALPGISGSADLAWFMGDSELYLISLTRFLERNGDAAGRIRRELGSGNLETAERMAHIMISGAKTIGALALSATARELQETIHAGTPGPVSPVLARFEADLAAVLEGLKEHLRPSRGPQDRESLSEDS